MEKEIIILATSEKYNNYCVAGVDTTTGQWIRVISEDDSIENAVTEDDMRYSDGTMPEIFDVAKIKCKSHQPSFYQPENFVLDNTCEWEKIGEVSLKHVLRIHPADIKQNLFYDTSKRIHKDQLKSICNSEVDKHSLILIAVNGVTVHVDEYPDNKKVKMSFNYNGQRYKGISVTDLKFKNTYLEYPEGNYRINETLYLVVSLGVCYSDDHHYKLIATVLNY